MAAEASLVADRVMLKTSCSFMMESGECLRKDQDKGFKSGEIFFYYSLVAHVVQR